MRVILLLLILFLRHFPTEVQVSLEQLNLVPGQYRVGFAHYTTSDSSRTYQRIFDWTNQSVDRPIPISIWYPSNNIPASAPFKVLEYMRILKEEEEWEYLPDEQILNWFYYPNTIANQKRLHESTGAHTLVQPATGKFPIILYARSFIH